MCDSFMHFLLLRLCGLWYNNKADFWNDFMREFRGRPLLIILDRKKEHMFKNGVDLYLTLW